MTLPDWGPGILDQVQAFLEWDAVSTTVQVLVGVAIGAVLLTLFLKVFLR